MSDIEQKIWNDKPIINKDMTKFRRYKKLSEDVIELGDGLNPPSGYINPDYKQQPSNPRKCVQCGKTHDTIVENTMTGERIEELSKCKDCMLFGTRVEWGGTARCITSDGRNVNMAEELTRLEKELLNESLL